MWVRGILREFCASICSAIYKLVALLYELFINISRATILSSNDIKTIYSRITLILAIVMTFYVTFEFVKYVVQPDSINDKEKGAGNLIFKMVMVVLLIAFVPTIFSLGYKLQNVVFEQQIFSKVILGKVNVDQATFGRDFAANIFSSFYRFDEEKWGKSADEFECDEIPCGMLINENLSGFRKNGDFPAITLGLDDDSAGKISNGNVGNKDTPEFYITFDGLFAIATGLFVAYILLMYCVDAGVRVVQLAFLQIIAPIPIIGYLSPKKDNMFSKWGKQCITTYLDLFFRLGIIHIVILIIQILTVAYEKGTLIENVPLSSGMKTAVYVFIILGLLLFAKKAPKMLQELFPKMGAAAGNFGLKPGERMPTLAARAAGATLGAGVAGLRGGVGNLANRIKRNHANKEQRSGAKQALKDRKGEYKSARSTYKSARAAYRADPSKKKEFEEAKKKLNDAKIARDSAKADRDITKYRTAAGAALSGIAQGAFAGASTGMKAKKLEDIGKQGIAASWKKEGQNIATTEKWYDEGGTSHFDRTVSNIEKGLGITTASHTRTNEIKRIDDDIKQEEAIANAEKAAKSGEDSAKSRSADKIESKEQKIKLGGSTLSYTDVNGNNVSLTGTAGKTTSQIYGEVTAEAENAEKAAAAKQNALEQLKASGTATTAEIDAAKADAEAASKDAMVAKDKQSKVKKALQEAAITEVLSALSGDTDAINRGALTADGVLVDTVKNTLSSIEESKRNPSTLEKIRGILSTDEYNAYTSGVIKDFKTMDHIQAALTATSNERTRGITSMKETKRRLETSSETASFKANDNSGSSGK